MSERNRTRKLVVLLGKTKLVAVAAMPETAGGRGVIMIVIGQPDVLFETALPQ
jgi:hypothetical protein